MNTNFTGDNIAIADFTPLRLERFHALKHLFSEDAAILVPLLKARGENSYAKVYDKALRVKKLKGSEKEYAIQLSEEIMKYDVLSSDVIISIVSEVRDDLELDPYKAKIKALSMKDFFAFFVFEEICEETTDGSRGNLVGYKALFSLVNTYSN